MTEHPYFPYIRRQPCAICSMNAKLSEPHSSEVYLVREPGVGITNPRPIDPLRAIPLCKMHVDRCPVSVLGQKYTSVIHYDSLGGARWAV